MADVEIGTVIDFFSKVMVAGVTLSGTLKVGEKLHFKGHTTDFEMVVSSMQINNADVQTAKPADDIGIKVTDRVRHGDKVYRVD